MIKTEYKMHESKLSLENLKQILQIITSLKTASFTVHNSILFVSNFGN